MIGWRVVALACWLVAGSLACDDSSDVKSDTNAASLDQIERLAESEIGGLPGGDNKSAVTSIDPELQRALEDALDRHMPDTHGRFVAAAAVIDVPTESVVALAATSFVSRDIFDQLRPSGSTLKLVLDVALAERGVRADDGVIGGRNCNFPDIGQVATPDDVPPIMSIRDATAHSVNCAFAKIARMVGPDELDRSVSILGVSRRLDTSTAFGFGANSISMRELTSIATTVLNGGSTARVHLRGSRTAVDAVETNAALLDPNTMGEVARMTGGVLTSGTASGHALPDRWAIAKTGTAEANTDAWIVGGTPQFVSVVWIGNPNIPADSMTAEAMPGYNEVHGGDLPASIWQDVMTTAHRSRPVVALPASEDREGSTVVIVDRSTDCRTLPDIVRIGEPGPLVPWVPAGVPIGC